MTTPKNKTLVELVIPDVHNRFESVYTRAALVAKGVDRVYFVGDMRNQIDFRKIQELVGPKEKALFKSFEVVNKKLESIVKRYGSPEQFSHALQDGTLKADEVEVYTSYASALQKFEQLDDALFEKEVKPDYDKHEAGVKKILAANPKVKCYGVPGNHDTIFVRSQVPSIEWLTGNNVLEDERVFGAYGLTTKFDELQPAFNGPELKYLPADIDDDYDDIGKSEFYKERTGQPIDLLLTHNGGEWGDLKKQKRIPGRAGKGITQLGKENGFVVYEGHIHSGLIYHDEESGVLIIRPGVLHVAKVFRDGKNVERIELYQIPQEKYRRRAA